MIERFVNDVWGYLIGLLPWWAPYVGWAALALLVLFILSMVKNVAGWPGVVAALMAIVAGLSAAFGFKKGVEWADKRRPAPKPDKPPRKPLWPF